MDGAPAAGAPSVSAPPPSAKLPPVVAIEPPAPVREGLELVVPPGPVVVAIIAPPALVAVGLGSPPAPAVPPPAVLSPAADIAASGAVLIPDELQAVSPEPSMIVTAVTLDNFPKWMRVIGAPLC